MIVEKISPDEVPAASSLIKDVFDEFIAPDYSGEGIEQFNSFIDESTIKKRLAAGSLILLAKDNDEIVGFFELREGSHIPLFFVKGEHHGKGIGRRLFRTALKINKEACPGAEKITVNSSPRAVNFYKNLGFRQSAVMQIRNGITYYPMQYSIK